MTGNNGLVVSFQLNGMGGGTALDWQGISELWSSDSPIWVHLDYTHERSRSWLREQSGIDDVSIEALLAEETRPRTTLIQGNLLVILRGVNLNPGSDPEDMVSIRVWTDGKRVISTRKRKLLSISDICQEIERGEGPASVGEFLLALADRLSIRMNGVISQLDDGIDDLEQQVLSLESHQLRPRLSAMRRETITLRRYLSPQRDALARLTSERFDWLSDVDRAGLREVTDRTVRYIEELDAARERAIVVQEELMSRLSEQMDRRMYVLSIVAALFLPLGFLTGLLGINVGGIPGTDNPGAFSVVATGLLSVLIVQIVLFRWKRWF